MIQAVLQPYRIQGLDVHITASVGVAIYLAHGDELETLLKGANLALYEAKHASKNYRIAARTAPLAMAHN